MNNKNSITGNVEKEIREILILDIKIVDKEKNSEILFSFGGNFNSLCC